MWKKILLVLVLALGYYKWSQGSLIGLESPLAHAVPFAGNPTLLEKHPLQKAIDRPGLGFEFGDYRIEPLATFELKAKVLGSKHYRAGREADLSPVDLALGWGPMADERVLAEVNIRQSGRFYYWRVERFPIPQKEIETHSANMHMIPANEEIDRQLRRVNEGDSVKLRGYLVRIDARDGWSWKSSLSRADTGGGACEVVLVESLDTY